MIVTDVPRIMCKGTPREKEIKGFYMDGYLAKNLADIPAYLKKDFDVVGIVSGCGLVGVGKSSLGIQTAYYLSWLIAGGEMDFENKCVKKIPDKPMNFNLEENIVFSAEELKTRAEFLFNKYGKNQVIVADEGRQGLESARTMESINKGMEDFFQECRQYGHVIIIVLPNFFKLHEDYAVARSLFLIDCFLGKHFDRGFFNFYNKTQKEWLYYLGKKKIGVTQKYTAAWPNFWGRFTKWLPFEKSDYEKKKAEGLRKKILGKRDKAWIIQRNFLLWYLHRTKKMKREDISKILKECLGITIMADTITHATNDVEERIIARKGIEWVDAMKYG